MLKLDVDWIHDLRTRVDILSERRHEQRCKCTAAFGQERNKVLKPRLQYAKTFAAVGESALGALHEKSFCPKGCMFVGLGDFCAWLCTLGIVIAFGVSRCFSRSGRLTLFI